MNKQDIWKAIDAEMRKAKKKHPNWPDHPAAQAGIVTEEAGELMQACLQFKYEPIPERHLQIKKMRDEAIQTAVTAIRFLENLNDD